MTFVSTSIFRDSIKLLTKRIDSGYSHCLDDVCKELNGLSFDDIYVKHFVIRQMGDLRVIKLRIQNSELGISSAAGYRLIIACNKKYDHIVLLEVYPKKGKHNRSDLTKTEYREILNRYGEELKASSLVTHDINNRLDQI